MFKKHKLKEVMDIMERERGFVAWYVRGEKLFSPTTPPPVT